MLEFCYYDSVRKETSSSLVYQPLQEVKTVSYVLARLAVDGLTNKEGKLVGILARSRNTDCALRVRERTHNVKPLHTPTHMPTYRPVVVQVAQFVCKPLHVVRLQSGSVVNNVEASGSHRSLPHRLVH